MNFLSSVILCTAIDTICYKKSQQSVSCVICYSSKLDNSPVCTVYSFQIPKKWRLGFVSIKMRGGPPLF
jgi:hypothetical protein